MNASPSDPARELDELLALPEGDPRRAELLRSPRLRALLRDYQSFVAEPTSATELPSRLQSIGKLAPRRTTRARTLWRTLAVAASIASLALLGRWVTESEQETGGRLRSAEPSATGAMALVVQRVDGALRVEWEPVEAARRYEVELLDAALQSIQVLAMDEAGAHRIELPEDSALLRVRALGERGVIAHSKLVAID